MPRALPSGIHGSDTIFPAYADCSDVHCRVHCHSES
jgi:hypothetical protein